MHIERPDLSQLKPDVLAYIQFLEAEVERLQGKPKQAAEPVDETPLEPEEKPTPINIISTTRSGIAKRTPRHLYNRQRRGGMGVFDLEAPDEEPASILAAIDENQSLLMFTNLAHGFRVPVSKLQECPVRSRGTSFVDRLPLEPGEHPAVILPGQATGYVALVSQNGMIRCLRHHLFGEYMRQGTAFFNSQEFGPLAAACWTPGDGDLLIATRSGVAIRFSEKLVPPQGVRGIRVDNGDTVVAVTPVKEDSGVFFVGGDGRGTIRVMSGFNPNKAPGGGGKIAMKTDNLIAAFTVDTTEDIFINSKLGKIIRFKAAEVPTTEGVVQGVICMSLRGDECIAAIKTSSGTAR